jgi:hypothetical protein
LCAAAAAAAAARCGCGGVAFSRRQDRCVDLPSSERVACRFAAQVHCAVCRITLLHLASKRSCAKTGTGECGEANVLYTNFALLYWATAAVLEPTYHTANLCALSQKNRSQLDSYKKEKEQKEPQRVGKLFVRFSP